MLTPEELFKTVVAAYEAEGYPHEIIGQWTLPLNDVRDLVEAVRLHAPRKVLEVGTFVGMSTMLIALAGRDDAHIFTVDPSFPLKTEMLSMGSRLGVVDAERPTQEIAEAVAHRLGVENRITFVRGAFGQSGSFASRRNDPTQVMPVVGPELCASEGPFDLAFIDGLHYADAVQADLEVASSSMAQGAIILMHDCIGMWGTNVRAGVGRFLASRPDWRFSHRPFSELYRSIGTVFRTGALPDDGGLRREPDEAPELHKTLHELVVQTVARLQPSVVIELHVGTERLIASASQAASTGSLVLDKAGLDALTTQLETASGTPLVVSAGALDCVADAVVVDLFALLMRFSAVGLFARTPPGELGAACFHSRPLLRWVTMAETAGLQLWNADTLTLAPNHFLFLKREDAVPPSSALVSPVLVATGEVAERLELCDDLSLISSDWAETIEQAQLLNVHYGNAFQSLFSMLPRAAEPPGEVAVDPAEQDGSAASDEVIDEGTDQRPGDTASQLVAADSLPASIGAAAMSVEGAAGAAYENAAEPLREPDPESAEALADTPSTSPRQPEFAGQQTMSEGEVYPTATDLIAFSGGHEPAGLLLEGLARHDPPLHIQALIANALDHAARRGHRTPIMVLDDVESASIAPSILADPRVGGLSMGIAGAPRADGGFINPRLVLRTNDAWALPAVSDTAYYAGSLLRLRRSLIAAAWRAGIVHLYARSPAGWTKVPVLALFRAASVVRATRRDIGFGAARAKTALASFVRKSLSDRQAKALSRMPMLMTQEDAFKRLVSDAAQRRDKERGRVILVCGNLAPGGAERQAANTLIGLKRRGCDGVSFLAHHLQPGPHKLDFHLSRVRAAGVEAREITRSVPDLRDASVVPTAIRDVVGALPDGLLFDIANLVREFEMTRPEVVHAWLDYDCVRAGIAAAIAGVPRIVLSGRNLAPYNFTLNQPFMRPAYRALATLPWVRLINNSRAGANDYAQWLDLEPDNIGVIYNGLDFGDARRLAEPERAALRASYGFTQDTLVIGGVFRFAEEKRPLLWLETAARLAARLPHARFIVFGQGAMEGEIKARIEAVDLKDKVVLAGVTDEPLRAMSLMDVFVLASRGEGLPNVLIEAQAVGTVVVTTPVGGAPEAVAHGVSGLVVESEEPDAIAAAVVALASSPDRLVEARASGPRFVAEKFGLDRMIDETIEIYALAPSSAVRSAA
jgi:glycosyltransferase involved in cell wall biosynthesis/predicted O-methyltransferase YrrM